MNKNFKNMSIGAIASVIAGAYYMYGSKEGQAKRKQIHAWSLKMKGEVMQGLEKLKEVSEPKYKEIVKNVSAKYKNVDKTELNKVVAELTSTWNKMKKDIQVEIAKKQAQIEKENKSKTPAKTKTAKPTAKKKPAKKTVKKVVAKKVEVKTAAEPVQEVKVDNNPTM